MKLKLLNKDCALVLVRYKKKSNICYNGNHSLYSGTIMRTFAGKNSYDICSTQNQHEDVVEEVLKCHFDENELLMVLKSL